MMTATHNGDFYSVPNSQDAGAPSRGGRVENEKISVG